MLYETNWGQVSIVPVVVSNSVSINQLDVDHSTLLPPPIGKREEQACRIHITYVAYHSLYQCLYYCIATNIYLCTIVHILVFRVKILVQHIYVTSWNQKRTGTIHRGGNVTKMGPKIKRYPMYSMFEKLRIAFLLCCGSVMAILTTKCPAYFIAIKVTIRLTKCRWQNVLLISLI